MKFVFAQQAKQVKNCRLTLVKESIQKDLKQKLLKTTLMIGSGKRFFISLVIILLFSTILTPLLTFSYLTNSYNSVIDTHINKEKILQQQVDSFTEQNKQLKEENSQLTNLTQPYLITSIGWYIHKSNDPVSYSKNTFTIYGKIYNIGLLPANNA